MAQNDHNTHIHCAKAQFSYDNVSACLHLHRGPFVVDIDLYQYSIEHMLASPHYCPDIPDPHVQFYIFLTAEINNYLKNHFPSAKLCGISGQRREYTELDIWHYLVAPRSDTQMSAQQGLGE